MSTPAIAPPLASNKPVPKTQVRNTPTKSSPKVTVTSPKTKASTPKATKSLTLPFDSVIYSIIRKMIPNTIYYNAPLKDLGIQVYASNNDEFIKTFNTYSLLVGLTKRLFVSGKLRKLYLILKSYVRRSMIDV